MPFFIVHEYGREAGRGGKGQKRAIERQKEKARAHTRTQAHIPMYDEAMMMMMMMRYDANWNE